MDKTEAIRRVREVVSGHAEVTDHLVELLAVMLMGSDDPWYDQNRPKGVFEPDKLEWKSWPSNAHQCSVKEMDYFVAQGGAVLPCYSTYAGNTLTVWIPEWEGGTEIIQAHIVRSAKCEENIGSKEELEEAMKRLSAIRCN